MVSPFAILDIDPDATDDTIEEAYRERIKAAHPDQGGSLEEFQLVRRAYQRLADRDTHNATDELDIDATETGDHVRSTRVTFLDHAVLDDYGWSLDDPDLFTNAKHASLGAAVYGRFLVDPAESLLEAAEHRGYTWPFSCRGGACANCAVYLAAGDLSQPADHVLSESLVDAGYRLSCNGYPITDELQVVFNVKLRPELEELMLPPGPFKRRQSPP